VAAVGANLTAMRGRIAAIIVSGAMAALIGGCGDDDSPIETISTEPEVTESTSGVSQEDFIASADAACAEANAALANVPDDSSSVAVGQRLGITQEVLSAVEDLGDPEDPDGDLKDFLAALDDQVSILEDQQTAATSGDTATVDSLSTELDAAEVKAEAAGSAYGFEECGQPPSASSGATTTGGTTPGGTTTAAPTTPATTTPAPVTPAPEPEPVAPTGGAGAGPAPAPEPAPPTDDGGDSSGGFSP
jgi:hypothetical protein